MHAVDDGAPIRTQLHIADSLQVLQIAEAEKLAGRSGLCVGYRNYGQEEQTDERVRPQALCEKGHSQQYVPVMRNVQSAAIQFGAGLGATCGCTARDRRGTRARKC